MFIDFAKVYDCVQHDLLDYKLKCYGVSGSALNWCKTFLSYNTQQCKIKSNVSDKCEVRHFSLYLLTICDWKETNKTIGQEIQITY